ncbi:hypothetical protein B0W47_01375 [Komagataeibacter nataicola]|uniref:Uncharacterized protein n=1 Tax=Komagataeibacter nataicola TaxID=265960 RepID=A0A9N7GZ88_9PROT|nr:hypothetical protein B0W47_01375 [Komagataeibacter nataicola]PYD66562.1 hypothetical protein CDI09_07535 [Komagataeibacter nataicola]
MMGRQHDETVLRRIDGVVPQIMPPFKPPVGRRVACRMRHGNTVISGQAQYRLFTHRAARYAHALGWLAGGAGMMVMDVRAGRMCGAGTC